MYSKEKDSISGVGSSIGLDRLLAALESINKLPDAKKCLVAIACTDTGKSGEYQALAQKLRLSGIPCEVFLEGDGEKQLVKQFILAEKKGMRYVIIPGDNPLKDKTTLRDLAARQNIELSLDEVIKKINNPAASSNLRFGGVCCS